MTYLLILLCIFFLILGLACSKNNIFSPSTLTPTIWLFVLVCYLILGEGVYILSPNLYLCLFIWISGICTSSLVFQSATYHDPNLNKPSETIRNIYLIISVIFLFKLYKFASVAITNGSTGYIPLDLRLAALGLGSGFNEPFGGFFVLIWQTSFILELLCYDKNKKWRLLVASSCFLLFGIVTMAKITFLNFFVIGCSILYFKKIVNLKHILSGLCILALFFIILQVLRMSLKLSDINNSIIVTYVISNLTAFDSLSPCSAEHFGENTFRIIYAIFYKLGISSVEPIDTILNWVEKPIQTNTYTTMYPFYVDFGIIGITFFSILMGSCYGWLFKKAQMGSNFYIAFYPIILNVIIMQYAADQFFINLTTNIKLFFILAVPFLFTKHNLLTLKNKFHPNN